MAGLCTVLPSKVRCNSKQQRPDVTMRVEGSRALFTPIHQSKVVTTASLSAMSLQSPAGYIYCPSFRVQARLSLHAQLLRQFQSSRCVWCAYLSLCASTKSVSPTTAREPALLLCFLLLGTMTAQCCCHDDTKRQFLDVRISCSIAVARLWQALPAQLLLKPLATLDMTAPMTVMKLDIRLPVAIDMLCSAVCMHETHANSASR